MRKCGADEMILSYNDVVLRRSDLGILSGAYYINDCIIEFYFSYLTLGFSSEDDVLLVPPSIAFWAANCPDSGSLKDFLEPLNLSAKKLVIFPVNDNSDVTAVVGGSHWSLLAFWRNANVFVHHDSYSGMNERPAKCLHKAVTGQMGISNTASPASYLKCSSSPQQVNGYDCGLYVLAIARAICYWCESAGPKDEEGLWYSAVNEQVTPSLVAGMREEILRLIESLMAKN